MKFIISICEKLNLLWNLLYVSIMAIIHIIFSLSRKIILLDKLNTCNIILWHLGYVWHTE